MPKPNSHALNLMVLAALLATAAPLRMAIGQQQVPADAPKSSVLDLLPELHPGFLATPDAATFDEVCPGVRIQEKTRLKIKDMELRLLCGDDGKDPVGLPWSRIPPNEAAYFLRGFLQSRGFHQPRFIQDGDTLFVILGSESFLKSFRVAGAPKTWNPPKRRLVLGKSLTPKLLDDLQGWSLAQIKNVGYACATASSRADPLDGGALVTLQDNGLRLINNFKDTGATGLRPGVLDRYNAFRVGDLYRDYLIALTRKRTQDDGFLQTYVMTTVCDPEGVTIERDVILGPSRTIRIGAGASNDRGAIIRTSVRESRIGTSASSAQASADLSFLNNSVNQQNADLKFNWFYLEAFNRSFVQPSLSFTHDAEEAFEKQEFNAKMMHGWTHELADGQFEALIGPSFLDSHLYRGVGPSDVTVSFLETNLRWTHHLFEYFATSPRAGDNFDGTMLLASKGVGSAFTAQKLQLQGEKLWTILPYDPPLFVLATRFNVASVFSPDPDIGASLPPRFLTFLGGDGDLRGFDQASLPRSGVGALSAATVSLEARAHKVILQRIDAFTFLDSGLLGGQALALRRPYLMSPGVGLRWESPIGVLRTYIAERFAIGDESSDQPTDRPYDRAYRVGFTFGQEF